MVIGNGIGVSWGKVSMARGPVVNEAFEFTVKTDNAGTSAADQFTIPITSTTPYNISTSDGHSITGATGATTLTFSAPGTYTVSITESCEGWRFVNGGDKLKLLNISNWGVYANTTFSTFQGASNMTCSATDKPTGNHTTMYRAFYGCTNFNGAIGNWDVSNVTDYAQFVAYTQFNQPLANWSINTVGPVDFRYMFWACPFNQDISGWDTSAVTDMSFMFNGNTAFNQDISGWNVSSVTTFENTFAGASSFDYPLNSWDVSSATNMANMFGTSTYNHPMDSWNVSNVTNMRLMFNRNPAFNQDLNSWDVSSVTNMEQMFNNEYGIIGQFNGNITSWDTSSVTNMKNMFNGQEVFNQDISVWDVSSVTTFEKMFFNARAFNQPIGAWNLSGINSANSLAAMFLNAWSFDQDLNNWSQYLTAAPSVTNLSSMFASARDFNNGGQPMNWDVSNITSFGALFSGALSFNQDLGAWDMSSATSISEMFRNTPAFTNGGSASINNWNTSSVTNMSGTFYAPSAFNQPIGGWDTSSVTNMGGMFYYNTSFDQPIGSWDTSNVTNMASMFYITVIDQDLSNWNIGSIPPNSGNFNWNKRSNYGIPFSTANYDAMLVAYEAQVPPVGLSWNIGDATYSLGSAAETARTSLINTYGWTITDGGGIVNPMIITIDTTLGDGLNSYTLNFTGTGYDIETSDGQTITGATTATTINFAAPGTYDIEISGGVSTRSFINDLKLIDIKKWGSVDTPLAYAFGGANSLTTITAPDQPVNLNMAFLFRGAQNFVGGISHWNVSGVTDFSEAFYNTSFNEDISSWDTSSATNLNRMFRLTPFNNGGQPGINNWDVSNVANFSGMFQTCSSFNQPIGNWTIKTSGPVLMDNMFFQASAFNQPIDSWDVSAVTTMNNMFQLATSFNQDLNSWNLASVTNIINMFQQASAFNGNVSSWVFPNVTLFNSLFQQAVSFNQDISGWDTSNITGMYGVFRQATAFNQPIGSWDTSSVTTMSNMFFEAEVFNQNINNWDTSSVVDMQYMFYGANAFNQPVNFWDTSSVTNMQFMFYQMPFNKPIGMWDTSSLISINGMFESNSAFNQDISNWNILSLNGSFTRFRRFGRNFDITNYDELLVSWYNQLETAYPGGVGYPNTVTIDFRASQYSLGGDAEAARTALISTFGWTITDGGAVSNPFVFVVKTDQAGGVSATDQFAFPLDASSTVNATVDWGDGNINTITAYNDPNATHTYATAGTYTISVTGILNGWRFNNGGDRYKLLDITQWGIFDMNLSAAFYGCQNLTGSWTDHPRLGNGNFAQTFANCFLFTGDVSEFSTVGVTAMNNMMQLHYSNSIPDVSNWDVSSVANFGTMFRETNMTGVDLSSWDVRNATSMAYMFYNSRGVIPDLSMWKVAANITNRNQIFSVANMFGARSYNYGFESWEVGKCNFDGQNLMTGANTMPQERYDSTLIAWSNNIGLGPQSFSNWTFGASNYALGGAAEAARNNLINNYNFTFVDGGGVIPPFRFTVDTTLGDGLAQFTIPTTGTGYNYDVATSDGQSITGNTGNTTITFPASGTYDIEITGDFPRIFFDGTGDRLKITNISKWGVGVWDSFYRAFYNCNNMTITATDVPNVSAVTSFYFGFRGTAISGAIDLSSWDLSSVDQIGYMFANCTGITSVNLSSLNTNAIASDGAFLGANNTTTVILPVGFRPTVFRNMFSNASSLTNIVNVETWNLSSAVRGDYWLQNTTVQPNISGWTIPPTFTILKGIFGYCQFNVDVSGWDVSNVQDFSELCAVNPAFNQDISGWNMASATTLDAAFASATSFNQPIGSWNVSNVTSMNQVFQSANAFNQDLSGWNTSNVTTMRQMFLIYAANPGNTTLNSIGSWDVSNVTDMYRMFESVNWGNPNISSWNTQNVQNFGRFMQSSGQFNRDLSGWNTSSATDMSTMFGYGNSQPGNIASWDIDQMTNFTNFMISNNSALSTADYDAVLVSWENQLQTAYPGGVGYTPVISIHFGASQYTLGSAAATARASLISTFGWTITDGGGI